MRKNIWKKAFLCSAVLGIGILAGSQKVEAGEMPSTKQWKQYESDGTLKQRIQYYKDAGGESYSKGRIQEKNASEIATYSNLPEIGNVYMPAEGEAKVLLLRVDFPDVKFEEGDTEEALKNIAFGGDTGAYTAYPYENLQAYYERSSYGKLHITGDTMSYTAQHERSYYETVGIEALYKEALEAMDPTVDFSQYDGNDDGYIDGLYMHFAGYDSGWGSIWWSMTYQGGIGGEYDGKHVGGYVTLHEQSDTKDGAQTLIHETGHLLGLADYYTYTDQVYDQGINTYDMMMDNVGDHNAFSKWLLGWIEDDEIKKISLSDNESVNEAVTLESLSKEKNGEKKYKCAVVSPKDEGMFSEYLMIEYDTELGNQTGLRRNGVQLPDGFRVFHVHAELSEYGDFKYDNHRYNDQSPKLIELLDKDQKELHGYGFQTGDLALTEIWGGEEKYDCKYLEGDKLTPETTPSTNLQNGQVYQKSGISIQNFKPDGDTGEVQIELKKIVPTKEDMKVTIEDTWRDIQQNNIILLPVTLEGNPEQNTDKEPYLVDKNGNKTMGSLEKGSEDGKYFLIIQSDYLETGDYDCVIPAGTFTLNGTLESDEQKVQVHVGENMKKKISGTLDVEDSIYSCTDQNGGWYLLAPREKEETEVHLYHIAGDGTLTDQKIMAKDWSDAWGYSTSSMSCQDILSFKDGTLVLAFVDYEEDVTKLVHINNEGRILDPEESLAGGYWKLYAVGNTIKAVRDFDTGEYTDMFSVKFGEERKELEIQPNTTYKFMKNGYIEFSVENKADEDTLENEMWIELVYKDEQDKVKNTWEFPYGAEDGQMNLMDIAGAYEDEENLYLFALNPNGHGGLRDGFVLRETYLEMYTIDKRTGAFQVKDIDDEALRLGVSKENYAKLELYDISEENGKILFSITSWFSPETASVVDTYCLEKDGIISKRIGCYYGNASLLSGTKSLEITWDSEHPEYTVYDAEDKVEPDTPDNPETPDQPGTSDNPETPEQPGTPEQSGTTVIPGIQKQTTQSAVKKTTVAQKASGTKKASNAKTGDTSHVWTYLLLLCISGGSIVAYIMRKRKKK